MTTMTGSVTDHPEKIKKGLTLLNAQSFTAKLNSQQIDESEIMAKTIAMLGEGTVQIQKAAGKDVLLFIGATGSGKSTTFNYLLDEAAARQKKEK